MSYSIIDAINDEVKLLKEQEKWAKKGGKSISEAIYYATRCSLQHIALRMTEGVDIHLNHNGTTPSLVKTAPVRKTDMMLERENAALQQAGENYRLIRELVSEKEKENTE